MDEKIKNLIDRKAKELAQKGNNISNLDLYNLCILNKMRETYENTKSNKTHAEDQKTS